MITHLPADIELSFPFRVLCEKTNKTQAAYIFMRLWADLAFQSRVHGRSGVYEAQWLSHFENTLKAEGIEGARQWLVDSGLIQVQSNGDWFCPIFFEYNAHLDKSYVPQTYKWMRDWDEFFERCAKPEELERVTKKLPAPAWYLPNGDPIPERIMNRGILIIRMLDVILHRDEREYHKLDVGTLHAACAVAQEYSDTYISVVLRRFLALGRPRLNPLFPPTTEEALARWKDVCVLARPDEGYDAWLKRIENPDNEKAQIKGIKRELAEALTGIPTEGGEMDSSESAETSDVL